MPFSVAAQGELPALPIQFNPTQSVNQGRMGSVEGGCDAGPLSAIAYTNPQTQASLSTRTSQAQPTLWVYSPTPINAETEATFTIKNSLSAPLYEARLSGQTDSAGIIGIPLSTNLTVGDSFQWSLVLKCSDNAQAVLSGWIERRMLDSALNQTFAAVSDRNRAALYANYGFLQDTLSELADLRLENPQNEALTQDWSTLLTDFNLSELAAEPLLSCCEIGKEAVEPLEEAVEEADREAFDSETSDSETSDGEEMDSEEIDSEAPELTEQQPLESELEAPEESESSEQLEEAAEDSRTMLQRARDRG
ncbi:MAG: DUF928 domain-containing protein [Phormidesmis sp.]